MNLYAGSFPDSRSSRYHDLADDGELCENSLHRTKALAEDEFSVGFDFRALRRTRGQRTSAPAWTLNRHLC
ncbi:MAG: hypothetical protein PHF83_06890 [Candidatus Methanomethylophilus sp.]|nr:hypothetical protein [Methanomethylophilus sp.]